MPLRDSSIDWTELKRESMNLKKYLLKLPKLKGKEKKIMKKIIQKLWENYKRYKILVMVLPE